MAATDSDDAVYVIAGTKLLGPVTPADSDSGSQQLKLENPGWGIVAPTAEGC